MPADPFIEIASAQDPHPALHELRGRAPAHFVESLGFWFITSHRDVKRLLHDPEYVTADSRAWSRHVPAPAGTLSRWAEEHGLFTLNSEQHGRMRRLVAAAFTPRAIARMERQIEDEVHVAATPLQRRFGEILDLAGGFTNVVPLRVICRITDVAAGADEQRFRTLVSATLAGFYAFASDAVRHEAECSFKALSEMLRAMLTERQCDPREDLLSDLAQAILRTIDSW